MKNKRNIENIKLMVDIARLYYEERKTQEEIGEMLGISRIKVLRLLSKAREEGIISIKIIDPFSTCQELERKLEENFNLEKAIVIPSGYLPKSLILRRIGNWGASLLCDILQDGDVVGIGWGSTVSECVRQLSPTHKKDLVVVPLGGGTGQIDPIFQVNELSKMVANKFKSKWYSLDIPIFVKNKETKNVLFSEPRVKKVIEFWDKLTVVLVGVGNIPGLWKDYSPLVAFSRDAIEILKNELNLYRSVGDMVQNYFDINGNITPISLRENIISISAEQIKNSKKVIVVSGGEDKKEALLGALRLGYITHLVTDESAARYLVEGWHNMNKVEVSNLLEG